MRAPVTCGVPYTEIAPPSDLAPYVDRLWLRTTVGRQPGELHRVLPDGCVDIIVHADRGAAELVGTMTRALAVPDAAAELVAVRFRPGAAAAIARGPLTELTDRHADLAELGHAGALADQVSEAATARARIAALVAWLRRRLAGAALPDPMVARAVDRLSAGERVDQVAGALGVTRQYLARRFQREVGISPKQLARIARMQRAAAAIGRAGQAADLARIAAELGYFDQAHLSNELHALIGITPGALAREPPVVLSHLFAPRGDRAR
ncbi:MAG TPA: DUF6597 domain-containing transcriptional factor [Kofleriaceae bacterium]|nr:DUF6597 domain-containing transcriptional factor [Kofleriaceae bacterium]